MKAATTLRILRITLVTLATLATLFVLATLEENWRGKHAWEAAEARLRASGEQIDPASFSRPPIPDRENFMATDFMLRLAGIVPDPAWSARLAAVEQETDRVRSLPLTVKSLNSNSPPDLAEIAGILRNEGKCQGASDREVAEAFLGEFGPIESDLRTLRQEAKLRIEAQLDGNLQSSKMVDHWGAFFSLSRNLTYRAGVELALGRSDEAFADARIVMRMMQATESRPLLLSALIGQAISGQLISILTEGEQRAAWNHDEFEEFHGFFASYDHLAVLERSMRGERAFSVDKFNSGVFEAGVRKGEVAGWIVGKLVPTGWIYRSGVEMLDSYGQLLGEFDLANHRFDAEDAQRNIARLKVEVTGPYNLFRRRGSQTLFNVLIQATKDPSAPDICLMVTSIELYRQAHGAYPSKLESLVPEYMSRVPTGEWTGLPPAYAVVDANHFRLTSAGWHEGADHPEWSWQP